MNKRLIIYLFIVGLVSLFTSCEKDETKAVLSSSPIAPTITTWPSMTLVRSNGNDVLTFKGTPVNPGFEASANYYLDACISGNNFEDALTILSGQQDTLWTITTSDLNTLLLKKFDADKVTSVDFRIRAVLVAGNSTNNLVYSSTVKNDNVTLYGLPRLDLISGGVVLGKIESPLGDGNYSGYVKLDKTKPFTFLNPDANITYGGTKPNLAVDGTAITPGADGWHKISVKVSENKFEMDPYVVGAVGAFNNWGNTAGVPDILMDYDSKNGWWYTTTDLPTGPMKFRLNQNWDVNFGPGVDGDTNLPADGTIELPKSTGNINITTAANYTIRVTVNGSAATAKFIKNN